MKNISFSSRGQRGGAIIVSLLLLITLGATFAPSFAMADTTPPADHLTADQQKAMDNITCNATWGLALPGLGTLYCSGKEIVGNLASATFGLIMQGVGYVILSIANFFLFLIGVLFNYVVIYTVFQFGLYFGNSAGLLAAWSILRDVANIMLIFGFVMLGIATILDIHSYEVKKTLPRLIIFAILMNFSLLASEAVIDTSNSFAAVFYSQASTQCPPGKDAQCATGGSNAGISAEIVQMAGITSIFSAPNPNSNGTTKNDDASSIQWGTIYIGMALFVTILCVVLLAGSIMLITRAITLAILMILSPLGFAGLAIPPLEKYAMMWWNKLLSQAFFAPVYLLFIFVALKIIKGLSGGTLSVASALTDGNTGAIGSVLIFSLLIGFLIAALMTAKNMGAVGASFATKMAGGAVIGGVGFVGRRTVGRGSAFAATKIRNSAWAERNPGAARLFAGIADKGAKSSFDARQTGAGKALAGAGGLDFGKPGKAAAHGYHGIEEKAIKERVDFAKSLKDRDMTDDEWAKAKSDALADLNSKSSTKQNAQAALNKQQLVKDQLTNLSLQNPADAALASRAAKAQQDLIERERDLASADTELEKSTKAEAKIREERGKVKSKQRQETHAAAMEHERASSITLSKHANHEAAAAIKTYAGMSKRERTLAELGEIMKESKDEHKDDGAHTPAAKPAGGRGAPAGGGGHH